MYKMLCISHVTATLLLSPGAVLRSRLVLVGHLQAEMGADWQNLALIHILVGYEADLLGLVPFSGGGGKTANGLLIAGFLELPLGLECQFLG